MTDRQENNYSMKLVVAKVLETHEAEWTVIPKFASSVTEYRAKLAQWSEEAQKQARRTKGITDSKIAKRDLMAEIAVEVGAIVRAYAVDEKDTVLKSVVKYTFTKLTQTRDMVSYDRCLLIYETAVPLEQVLVDDYGLGSTRLASLDTAIKNFREMIAAPTVAKGVRKTSGKNIQSLLKETDGILKDSIDNMMLPFKKALPNFYMKYLSARMIIDLGHRKRVVEEKG